MKEQNEERDRALSARVDALPRSIEPSRDLWKGVAERIDASHGATARARRRWTIGASLALAAGFVVAGAGIAQRAYVERPHAQVPRSPAQVAPPSSAVASAEPAPAPVVLVPEEESFRAAIAALHTQLDPRLEKLAPGKRKAIHVSLDALDAAVAATRASLAEHPNDPDLREELDAEYEQQIQTLNDVLEWTTRT